MPKTTNHLNLDKKQLQNALIHKLANVPSDPVAGQIYYNTTSNHFFIHNGTAWQQITGQKMTDSEILTEIKKVDGTGSGLDADLLDGQEGSYYMPASTKLNSIPAPNGSVSLNNQKITGLADPNSGSQEAATANWVELKIGSAIQGLDIKQSVRVATISGIGFNGTVTYQNFAQGSISLTSNASDETAIFDGVTVSVNDRVLIRHFTDANAYLNGFYTVSATNPLALARTDLFHNSPIQPNAFVFVEQGNTLADTGWVLSTNSGTVGTTGITFTQFSSAGVIQAGNGLQKAGNVLAIDNTKVPQKYSQTIGDGTETGFVINHLLGTNDVVVSVRELATNGEVVLADVQFTSNFGLSLTVNFDTPPTTNQYRVTVIG